MSQEKRSRLNLLRMNPATIEREMRRSRVVVCIIGLGHVGLPLAVAMAKEGVRVIGCDKDVDLLKKLRNGESPIVEHSNNLFPGSEVLEFPCPNCGIKALRVRRTTFCPNCMRTLDTSGGRVRITGTTYHAKPRFSASGEVSALLKKGLASRKLSLSEDTRSSVSESQVVIITVGTPIDSERRPDTSALASVAKEVGDGLRLGSLVILRSTVSPGTTEGMLGSILKERSHLEPGRDFGLAHAPESTMEGLALFELWTLPKIIGGIGRRSAEATAGVMRLFHTPIYSFDSPKVTEAAKLFANIYRDVNIALANELALASEALGVDVMKAIEAAHVDPKTNLLIPGPGAGGFCLPKDGYYLSQPASLRGFVPRILPTARQVNESMPDHVRTLVREACIEAGIGLPYCRLTALGLAFKGNTGDTRESPSIAVIRGLIADGASIRLHDPNATLDDPRILSLGLERKNELSEAIRGSQVVVVLTDHLDYRGLTAAALKRMDRDLKVLVDARHIFDPAEVKKAGLVYRGIGQR